MKPLIGVTTYREPSRWGVWDAEADILHAAYARSIEVAGGIAVLLPPTDDPSSDAVDVVARLDGLIIAGGADVDPRRYTEDVPHERTADWREDRDAWELALLDAARESQLPVLGICRGMQVLNVALGGSLHQHLPDLEGQVNHRQDRTSGDPSHRVTLARDSRLTKVIGRRYVEVNSFHHQALHALGRGLAVAGRAPDGVVEAVEVPGRRFTFGVQWHAECLAERPEHLALFRGLVRAARGHEVAPRMVA
jgi:putative glutamine amidotransferase